ncbi:MAG TPA: cellulase family glycosylhydrolase [Bacteroidales bacterium]|jgi:aryl-phospho-beta-D-glucosidase BglC (GH1 family)|nr:cellulase family glycosylhydrolase [Bacteroidales bacterium]
MKHEKINRRSFVRSSAAIAAGFAFAGGSTFASTANSFVQPKNKLPRWKGFNLLDYFSPNPDRNERDRTTDEDLKWMADWGFDFVRLPMAYPRYINIDRSKQISPDDYYKIDEKIVDEIEQLVSRANKYKLHVSLNLHRAPGYCINAGFYEPYNLWKDKEAQDAFNFHWGLWAERFKNVSPDLISFDLLNEPAFKEDINDQFSKSSALPGDLYRKVAKGAADAIRKITPGRLIVADGNNVGGQVTPELFDLDMGQSCRGYYPHYVSHYQAGWVWKNPADAPMPVWPGTIDGQYFSREKLEQFYQPWIQAVNKGIGVHCGECGCWRKTPHNVFMAWFGDVIDILTKNNIGYALWNFRGDFGILDSGREDVEYTDWYGHKLDSKLLGLLKKY